MRICIPILAENTESAIRKMNRSYRFAGVSKIILELRVDSIQDPDLETILSRKRGEVMVTNRRKEEGGRFTGTEEERVRRLREAAALGADYVDIEASTEEGLISGLKNEIAAAKGGTKLIVSYHDFQGTPPVGLLKEKVERCGKWEPDIVKIATMARSVEDNLKVLGLIPHARRKGQEIVAFCMGSFGRISRVMSPLLGAYLGFAAANGHEASAPGQIPVRDLLKLLRMLSDDGQEEGK